MQARARSRMAQGGERHLASGTPASWKRAWDGGRRSAAISYHADLALARTLIAGAQVGAVALHCLAARRHSVVAEMQQVRADRIRRSPPHPVAPLAANTVVAGVGASDGGCPAQ